MPFRRERKLNGLPLRAHSLFTRLGETNRVGTNKNAARSKGGEECEKGESEGIKVGGEGRAEADGVHRGILDSNGGVLCEEELTVAIF